MYGYEVARKRHLATGTVYYILRRLELAGWVTWVGENGKPSKLGRPRRRFYSLTSTGRSGAKAALAELADTTTGT